MTDTESTASPPLAPHTWVIDHIAEQVAAVEVEGTSLMTVPIWLLPKEIHEGDVLRITRERHHDRSLLTITKDDEECLRRLAHSQEQLTITSKNDKSGDIVL